MIELCNVSYEQNNRSILVNLNLEVRAGECVALLGRSGCGKTTTLRLINRLLRPSVGKVLVEGRSTLDWHPISLRRRIGYVIQEVGLFPHFSVARNVALVPSLENWADDRINQRVTQLLELVGLNPKQYADRYPHELSGGQRQRVGIARALAADPPILLMDEPFGALDPITRSELQREFKRLQRQLGKTVVLVTHDLQEAMRLADRIAVLQSGKMVEFGNIEQLSQSSHPEVKGFWGSVNFEG